MRIENPVLNREQLKDVQQRLCIRKSLQKYTFIIDDIMVL